MVMKMFLRPQSYLLDSIVVMWLLMVLGLVTLQPSSVTGFVVTTSPTAAIQRGDVSSTLLWATDAAATTSTTTTTTLDGRKIKGDIQPLNNFVLVRTADAVESTEGGILLTGKAKIVKTEGTVVSLGPGRTHPDSGIVFDMPVAPGDGVVYGKYDGTEIDISGVKHTLIRDDDILVKFTGAALTLDTVDVVRDNVLVYVEKKEVTTEGGILLAASSKRAQKPSTGQVVKVGPGKMAANGELMAMEAQVGDMVKFRDFAGNEVEIDDKEYSVVKMSDILAKF
jgi:chaperonin GroES